MGHLGFVARSDWRYLPKHAQESLREADPGLDEAVKAGDRDENGLPTDSGNYYISGSEKGEPAGRWFGPATETLGFTQGQVVTSKAMETVFGQLQNPQTGEQLGTKPRTFACHEERAERLLAAEPDASPERRAEIEFQARKGQREACHYYDLTFTPEKSWSVLYAGLKQAGMDAEAAVLWSCLEDGYKAGITHLMDEAAYARTGRHAGKIAGRTSGRWEKATGWTATLWQHHTSRAGDPNLHIHGGVLNRVQLADGRWFSLDGTAIKNGRRGTAATISRSAEAHAVERLGLNFVIRADGKGREIDGVDQQLIDWFSSRRRAIDSEAERIAEAYRDRYQREPTEYELRLFNEQATLSTRARKPDHPPTGPELLAEWERTVVEQFGESLADVVRATGLRPLVVQPDAQHADAQTEVAGAQVTEAQAEVESAQLDGMADLRSLRDAQTATTPVQVGGAQPTDAQGDGAQDEGAQVLTLDPLRMLDAQLRRQVVEDALAELTTKFSVWRRDQVTAALDARLPVDTLNIPAAAQPALLDALTTEALAGMGSIKLSAAPLVEAPEVWRRADDGRGFHEPPVKYDRFSSSEILTQEERLVAIAQQHGATAADPLVVEAEIIASGLRPDQRAVVRTIMTSGRRVDTLIGPAGAGKSYTLAELARIWETTISHDQGEVLPAARGRVIGLAPSEGATRVLAENGITQTLNTKRFLSSYKAAQDGGRLAPDVEALVNLRCTDLVIVDEASMVNREQAHQLAEVIAAAGAKVVFAGDDRQLGAPEAGGAFDLLVERTRPTRLEEVLRFANGWEGQASLRLREGDSGVIYEYSRRDRIRSGTETEMVEQARRRYLADYLSGRDSLVITASNEQASDIASQIRKELVALDRVEEHGVRLGDDTVAGAGDLIQTRENNHRLDDGNGAWVANRDLFRVDARNLETGDLLVSRLVGRDDVGEARWGEQVTLPAGYVSEHVRLAYASTVHAVQGRTTDTCYPIVTPEMDAAALYTASTRGKERNLLFVITTTEEPDALGNEQTAETVTTPEAVLAGILERPRETQSATQVLAEEVDARESMGRLAPEWNDLITRDAQQRYRTHLQELLTPEQAEKLGEDPAEGPLLRAVRHAELSGRDPRQVLEQAVTARELGSADSIAQVLHHRITADTAQTELPAVQSYVARTPELNDPALSAHARAIATAMDERVDALGERAAAAEEQPAWAAPLGPVPADPAERLDWTRRAGVVAAYREEQGYRNEKDAIGPAPHAGAPEARQSWMSAYDALGHPDEQRDAAAAGDGQLRNQVREWSQKEANAPKNVDQPLRDNHAAAEFCDTESRTLQAQANLARDRGEDVTATEAEVATLTRAKAAAEQRLIALEEAAATRAEWYEATQAERRAADLARKELDRRGATELERVADGQDTSSNDRSTDLDGGQQRNEPARRQVDERDATRTNRGGVQQGQAQDAERKPVQAQPDPTQPGRKPEPVDQRREEERDLQATLRRAHESTQRTLAERNERAERAEQEPQTPDQDRGIERDQ